MPSIYVTCICTSAQLQIPATHTGGHSWNTQEAEDEGLALLSEVFGGWEVVSCRCKDLPITVTVSHSGPMSLDRVTGPEKEVCVMLAGRPV